MRTTREAKRGARRLYRSCLVDGLLDEPRARAVARRLAEARGRRPLTLLSEFRRLVRLDRARHTVRVESATALPADLRTRLQADLAREYGPGLDVAFEENPALIGGMRIRVGDDVFDGSILAALTALEKSL
jgi:F-type H+-transporting ATPase subunit delta